MPKIIRQVNASVFKVCLKMKITANQCALPFDGSAPPNCLFEAGKLAKAERMRDLPE